MSERPPSGELLGIPYNFERPSIRRVLSSYWKPDEGMLVEKPFGIGYTLNLANWRSWVVLGVVGALVWQESKSERKAAAEAEREDKPVEVVVD